jgi:kynurenine formamidase
MALFASLERRWARVELTFRRGVRRCLCPSDPWPGETLGWVRCGFYRLERLVGVISMCLPGTIEAVQKRVGDDGVPRITRRAALLGAAGAAAVATLPAPASARKLGKNTQDLTHLFREGFPVYVGDAPTRTTIFDFNPNGFYSQEWTFGEHSGTHMDAPGHFVPGGRHTPEITIAELIVPVVVIDISHKVPANPDAVVTIDDLVSFERGHGRIPRGAAVFMYSGWESRVGDPDAFKNGFHFPGFGIDALEWLLAHRDITAIGVDTLSLDFGASQTFDVHVTLLGADKYGLENLANLSLIPARGSHAFVGVVPWEEGSGGPCRVVAHW